jgi:hypothetical protein
MGLRLLKVSTLISCTLVLPLGGIFAQKTFDPGNICTDSLEFGSTFSPDGEFFYFSRSINKKTRILFSRKSEHGWSPPSLAPFNESNFSDADAAFSPSGDLYFISNRPVNPFDTTRDYNIWRVSPSQQGTWNEAESVTSLNSDQDEFYISFTKAGEAYFSSSRNGGFGEEDLYSAKPIENTFETPENLGPQINTVHSEYDPFISANGLALIFTSSGREDGFGKADLYWSGKKGNKKWMDPAHLPEPLNTLTRDFCPYITKDQKKFFYSSDREIKSISIYELPVRLGEVLKSKTTGFRE